MPDIKGLLPELERRVAMDQQLRLSPDSSLEELQSVDQDNTQWLKSIVSSFGWPKISEVGKDAAHKFWLLAQHADNDPALQEQILELMAKLIPKEATPNNYAYLTDRVLVSKGKPQKYGTQLVDKGSYCFIRETEMPQELNCRRELMGMSSIEEYAEECAETFGVPVYLSEQDASKNIN